MPRFLRGLQVNEVSSVDGGAGKGVRIVLMKRAESSPGDSPRGGKVGKKVEAYVARNLFAEAEAKAKLEKREFGDKERQHLAGTGAAMSDGSFPIENGKDLKNAITAVGRAKDPAKARAHIMSRARSLGLANLIPAKWKTRKAALKHLRATLKRFCAEVSVAKAMDFNAAQAALEAREYADGMMCEVKEAVGSLQDAIWGILSDSSIADKEVALKQTIKQFHDHLAGVVPEGIETALQAAQLIAQGRMVNAQGALINRREPIMADPNAMPGNEDGKKGKKRMKALKAKVKAAKAAKKTLKRQMQAQIVKLTSQVGDLSKKLEGAGDDTVEKRLDAILKLSPGHREWFFHDGNVMPVADRLAFLDAPVEKRDEQITALPIEKLEERRVASLSADVRKSLEAAGEARRISEESAETTLKTNMRKRADDLGLPALMVDHMVAVHKVAPAALEAFERVMKASDTQLRTAVIFKEFGANPNDSDPQSATAAIEKRVDELMKGENPPKSRNSAVSKISISKDPADQKLWQEYRDEVDHKKAA